MFSVLHLASGITIHNRRTGERVTCNADMSYRHGSHAVLSAYWASLAVQRRLPCCLVATIVP